MSETTVHKLSKVAKDCNVSLHTIVDFLKSKGHVVEANPMTKLSHELYLLVADQYKLDIAKAQEAAKVTTEHNTLRKENFSLDAGAIKKPEAKQKEEEEEDIIIKNVNIPP